MMKNPFQNFSPNKLAMANISGFHNSVRTNSFMGKLLNFRIFGVILSGGRGR